MIAIIVLAGSRPPIWTGKTICRISVLIDINVKMFVVFDILIGKPKLEYHVPSVP